MIPDATSFPYESRSEGSKRRSRIRPETNGFIVAASLRTTKQARRWSALPFTSRESQTMGENQVFTLSTGNKSNICRKKPSNNNLIKMPESFCSILLPVYAAPPQSSNRIFTVMKHETTTPVCSCGVPSHPQLAIICYATLQPAAAGGDTRYCARLTGNLSHYHTSHRLSVTN